MPTATISDVPPKKTSKGSKSAVKPVTSPPKQFLVEKTKSKEHTESEIPAGDITTGKKRKAPLATSAETSNVTENAEGEKKVKKAKVSAAEAEPSKKTLEAGRNGKVKNNKKGDPPKSIPSSEPTSSKRTSTAASTSQPSVHATSSSKISKTISPSPDVPATSKASSFRSKKHHTPELAEEDDEGQGGEEESSSEEDDHLHGFSTDDADSSDDEDAMIHEASAVDLGKLPTIAKDDATVKQKLAKAKRTPTEHRGVLFLGHIPHGFYEDALKSYFTQFGDVTRLRLSRNKKTGRSKGYGFIEFDSESVAQIVADTMNNYLLMGHILVCQVIPRDKVHPELWLGANRKWRKVPTGRVARVKHNKPRTEDEQKKAEKRLLKRQNQRKRKLAQAGLKYDLTAVEYQNPNQIET